MTDTVKLVQSFWAKYPVHHHKRGEIVLRPDGAPSQAIYVESGVVVQYTINNSGNKLTLNIYKPGSFMPLSSFLHGAPNDYFFEIQSPEAEIRTAPGTDAATFVRENPDVALEVLMRLTRGIDGLWMRLARHMEGTAGNSVSVELLIAARRFGTPTDKPGQVELNITEQQLAETAGVARETVNRELQKLKQAGIINRDQIKHITVDIEKLAAQLNT